MMVKSHCSLRAQEAQLLSPSLTITVKSPEQPSWLSVLFTNGSVGCRDSHGTDGDLSSLSVTHSRCLSNLLSVLAFSEGLLTVVFISWLSVSIFKQAMASTSSTNKEFLLWFPGSLQELSLAIVSLLLLYGSETIPTSVDLGTLRLLISHDLSPFEKSSSLLESLTAHRPDAYQFPLEDDFDNCSSVSSFSAYSGVAKEEVFKATLSSSKISPSSCLDQPLKSLSFLLTLSATFTSISSSPFSYEPLKVSSTERNSASSSIQYSASWEILRASIEAASFVGPLRLSFSASTDISTQPSNLEGLMTSFDIPKYCS